MELGVKIFYNGVENADYTPIDGGNSYPWGVVDLDDDVIASNIDQHIVRLAIENIIASTAPTYYGRWIDDTYKTFSSATAGNNFELILTASDFHDGNSFTNFVVLPVSSSPVGQMKTRGNMSYEAKVAKTLATYANNMGMIIFRDNSGDNFATVSNSGIRVGTDFTKMLTDLLDEAVVIFIPSSIERKYSTRIDDTIQKWYKEHKDRPIPVEVIF